MPPNRGASVSIPTSALLFSALAPFMFDWEGWEPRGALIFVLVGLLFPATVTLLTFLDPRCTDDCPVATELKEASALLGDSAPRVRLVAIAASQRHFAAADVQALTRAARVDAPRSRGRPRRLGHDHAAFDAQRAGARNGVRDLPAQDPRHGRRLYARRMPDDADELILKMQHLEAQARAQEAARARQGGAERLRTQAQRMAFEARQELVRQYLLQPSIETNEVAYLLGYEDPNSFYRAFRTWEGMTPAHWRSAQQARPNDPMRH